jgi:ferric-dicitrate binding protein FerR (iron transport regulator)
VLQSAYQVQSSDLAFLFGLFFVLCLTVVRAAVRQGATKSEHRRALRLLLLIWALFGVPLMAALLLSLAPHHGPSPVPSPAAHSVRVAVLVGALITEWTTQPPRGADAGVRSSVGYLIHKLADRIAGPLR